jgi:hypothetical protein
MHDEIKFGKKVSRYELKRANFLLAGLGRDPNAGATRCFVATMGDCQVAAGSPLLTCD